MKPGAQEPRLARDGLVPTGTSMQEIKEREQRKTESRRYIVSVTVSVIGAIAATVAAVVTIMMYLSAS